MITTVHVCAGQSQRTARARASALNDKISGQFAHVNNGENVKLLIEVVTRRHVLRERQLLANLPSTINCIRVVTEVSHGWRGEISFRMTAKLRTVMAKIDINRPDSWLNGTVINSFRKVDADATGELKLVGIPPSLTAKVATGELSVTQALVSLESAPPSVVSWTVQSYGCFLDCGFAGFMESRFDSVIRRQMEKVARHGLRERVKKTDIDDICTVIVNDTILSNECKDIALSLLVDILKAQHKASNKHASRRAIRDCWYEWYTEELIAKVKAQMTTEAPRPRVRRG